MRFLAALLLTPALACAAGAWERIDTPDRSAFWEYDKASLMTTAAGFQRILVRMTLSGIAPDKPTGQFYDHAIFIFEVDCAGQRQHVVDTVSYLRAERIEPLRTSEPWRPAPAGSVLYKAACG